MAGTARRYAVAAANRFRLEDIDEVEDFSERSNIDLVPIATSLFLQFEQAHRALRAGKHVICKRPPPLTPEHADESIELARRNDPLLVANWMQRYNSLLETIGELTSSRVLGALLHGDFEVFAPDEILRRIIGSGTVRRAGHLFIHCKTR